MKLKEMLLRITSDRDTHARWLNSLSYLEYRGFRKIARSQRTEDIELRTLMHALEEVRHALFFKKLALKVGGERFSRYSKATLLAEASIKSYFYDLDKGVSESSGDRMRNYHSVTWVIEERAIQVYREYENVLREKGFEFSLRPVLADESRHIDEVQGLLPSFRSERGNLSQLEAAFFESTWAALTDEIGS